MDRREGRKRGREEEAAAGRKRPVEVVDFAFEDGAAAELADGEPWRRPPGVFEFPWQKGRGGLGLGGSGGGWELRDVFFCSLVDGRTAAIDVPGDRLSPPPSKRTLFDDVDAWLAAAGEAELDPIWRSVLERPKSAA